MTEEDGPTGDPNLEDQALLRRIAGRDEGALASLYDRYASTAHALALRVLGDAGEAEDVLQRVILRVWQEAATYDPARGSLSAWLLSSVRNASIDRLRRREAHRRAAREAGARAGGPAAGPPVLREDHRRVVRAVEELPPDQREAIELAYFEGLSQSQIAERLGQPLGTVKTRMRLGMIKLRQALQVLSEEAH